MTQKSDMTFHEKLVSVGVIIFIVWVLSGISIIIVYAAKSDGKIDYCYYNQNEYSKVFTLKGHRPYRNDVVLATSESFEEIEKVRKLICSE